MAPDDWEARTSLVEEEDDEEVMAQEDGGARMRTCVALQGRLPSSGGLERMARVAAGSQAAARRRKGGGGDLRKTRQRLPVRDPWGWRVVGGGGSARALGGGLVRVGSGKRREETQD
jgi:hypothetical protein